MDKKKINIEHVLRSKSPNIIWPLLSTPEGMAKWIADEVRLGDDVWFFTWGNLWSHHEIRKARVLEKKDFEYIRFRWCDDAHEDTFWELRIEKSDLTGDYVLIITDFAVDGDMSAIEDIWDANLVELHRTTGL